MPAQRRLLALDAQLQPRSTRPRDPAAPTPTAGGSSSGDEPQLIPFGAAGAGLHLHVFTPEDDGREPTDQLRSAIVFFLCSPAPLPHNPSSLSLSVCPDC